MNGNIKPKSQKTEAENLHEAIAQSLGLILQSLAQQMNQQRLHADLQQRIQAARIVGINPLAIRLLEQSGAILGVTTQSAPAAEERRPR